MSINSPEIENKAEELNRINNQITLANAEVNRLNGLHLQNTENINSQVKTIKENEAVISEQVIIRDQLGETVNDLRQSKAELEKEIKIATAKQTEESSALNKEKEDFAVSKAELAKEKEAFELEKSELNKQKSEFVTEKESFENYTKKVITAINDK